MHPRRSHSRPPLPRRRDSSSPSPRWSGSRMYPSTTLPSGGRIPSCAGERSTRGGQTSPGRGRPTSTYSATAKATRVRGVICSSTTSTNCTRYTYEVFREFVAQPYEVHVTQPIPGKSVVSLQSCTLPDYSKRLIVQAELKDVS